MDKYTLFLDEAGNTGSRYLDDDQPFLVLAGWIIEDSKIKKLSKSIEELERDHSSTTHELKGKNLIKHATGQRFILKIIKTISSYGGLPFLFLVEKRYMVCAKIVETYFDPAFNHKINTSDQYDLEKRQDLAQQIYNTKSKLIESFAEAYRLRNSIKIATLNQDWVNEFGSLGQKEFADKFQGAIENIKEQMDTEFEVFTKRKNYDTLNLPMLVAMFQYVENYLPSPIKIVHDNTDSFKEAYLDVVEMFNNGSDGFVEFNNGYRQFFGFKGISNFALEDSKSLPLLRAADYIASSSFEYLKLVDANKDINELMNEIAFMTIGVIYLKGLSVKHPSLGSFPDLGTTFSSIDFVRKIFSKISVPQK